MLVPLLVFILWIAAMFAYPGWSALDPGSTSFDPSRNFVCDLLSGVTPDGRSNTAASLLMCSAAVLLVFGKLLRLWWIAATSVRWRKVNRALAAIAAVLTLTICLEQGLGLDLPHGAVTLAAGAAGLLPTTSVMVADWSHERATLSRRLLMLAVFAAALVNFVSYMMVQFGAPLTSIVPVAQNSALLLLLIWLAVKPAA